MRDFVELARAIAGKKGFGHMAVHYILGTGVVEWNIKGFVEGSNGGEEYMELGRRLGLGIGDRGEVVFWDRNGFQLRQLPTYFLSLEALPWRPVHVILLRFP